MALLASKSQTTGESNTDALFPNSFKPITVSPKSAPGTKFFTLHHSPKRSKGAERKVLLLLHGFPQNHTLYHKLVDEFIKLDILKEWDVVIPDLPGYGKSFKPPSPAGRKHYAHSKRAIAEDCVALIDELCGPEQGFHVVGHDRGARVAYRLASDHRTRVKGACLIEIVPTRTMWANMNPETGHKGTFGSYHWILQALPSPVPETLITNSSEFYIRHLLEAWTGSGLKSRVSQNDEEGGGVKLDFHPDALSSWITQYEDPLILQGALEDYRAGASIDVKHDSDPNSPAVDCPVLILCGAHLAKRFDIDKIWHSERLDTAKLTVKTDVGNEHTGHFVPYEAASDCAVEIVKWLS